jgi:rhodanese-related sulfurtransferase
MPVAEILPTDAAVMREFVVVDVRTRDERRNLGWIPGSRPMTRADLGQLTNGWFIVACQTGRRSLEVVDALWSPTRKLLNLTGGMRAWHSQGLPICQPRVQPQRSQVEGHDGSTRGMRVNELLRELRSCFVVEAVVTHADAQPQDPLQLFERYFPSNAVPASRTAFESRLDALAEAAWLNRHALESIARNTERFYRLAATVDW